MIYILFNKDLLTRYREFQFKGKNMEPAPLPDIVNEKEEYKVKEIRNHRK